MTLARIRSRLMRATCVCRVMTGCSSDAPISTAFCTMIVEARVLERREQEMQIAGARLSTRCCAPTVSVSRPLAAAGKARAAIRHRDR